MFRYLTPKEFGCQEACPFLRNISWGWIDTDKSCVEGAAIALNDLRLEQVRSEPGHFQVDLAYCRMQLSLIGA